mmetsp:Transcript_26000/g.56741  ORF Transcript_26000/g.56741 Transcript_26000/m.56741 type:complete len:427 (+) Transcript_26000:109-1389(+)
MATSSAQEPHEARESESPRQTLRQQFVQQRLKAWKPIFAPQWIIGIYIACGLLFLGIGVAALFTSWSVAEFVHDYTDDDLNSDGVGSFEFTVDKSMMAPIWIYYQLDGFHQNHRRYVKSRDDKQMREVTAPKTQAGDLSFSCHPWVTTDGRVNYPCGLVARSVFNDSYVILAQFPEDDDFQLIDVQDDAKTIAWATDTDGKFINLDPEAVLDTSSPSMANQLLLNMWLTQYFPPQVCEQIDVSGTKPWVPVSVAMRKDPLPESSSEVEVTDCTGYGTGSAFCNFTRRGMPFECTEAQGYRRVQSKDWGVEKGHFIVWMRIAGLPLFNKQWGKIDTNFPAGTRLKIYFQDNFPVKPYKGRKALVLTTTSVLGGRNDFLGYGFLSVGVCCLIFGFSFLWCYMVRGTRPLGDLGLIASGSCRSWAPDAH